MRCDECGSTDSYDEARVGRNGPIQRFPGFWQRWTSDGQFDITICCHCYERRAPDPLAWGWNFTQTA